MCALSKKGIVFGSGGARGLAHLGVIKVLFELGLKLDNIDYIAGTSMGAIVGAMLAQKNMNIDRIIKKIISMDKKHWAKLFIPHIPVGGFIKGERIVKFLKNFIHVKNIEDLSIPFGCAAYNFEKSEVEFFEKGSLLDALRASFAIPIIFEPHKINNDYYLDGGLEEPLPISLAKNKGIDKILVVNVVQKPKYKKVHEDLSKKFHFKLKKEKEERPKLFEVAIRNVGIIEWEIVKKSLDIHKPEFLIDVDTSDYNMLNFTRAKELILLGENTALRNAKLLKRFINE